jgi:3-hydroxyisobutyrate dehydrogenase-like beta-hydroxyacid dehydrogenase
MKVAFLGLGIMGSRMAANLASSGFPLTVWNRTTSTAEAFAAAHSGVAVAASPKAAATGCDLVFTMVVDGDQVRSVLLGDDGAAAGARAGGHRVLFVDCSTIGVAAARALAGELGERGFGFLDAPVTGSSPRAEDGTLTIMVGGSEPDFERARPALEAMGRLIVHAGAVGQGQLVKVINNAVAAANATTLAQALLLAAGAGADLDALVAVMGAGSGGSVMLDLKAGPMREHDFSTLFKLDHMLKDVRLCLEAAREAGVPFEFAQETARVLAEASEMGHGDDDFAALLDPLERSSGQNLQRPDKP